MVMPGPESASKVGQIGGLLAPILPLAFSVRFSYRGEARAVREFRERRNMASVSQAVVAEDQPLEGSEELRGLIATGTERGYLTFEEIASTLEEVEVTKEQVSDLHSHLVEQGVDVIAADGVTAYKESKGEKKQELDLTVEPSLDCLRLYLRSIG